MLGPLELRAEGLREQKKRRAREALERAGLELFQHKGYDNTTIKEIAAAADVSPRTFFRYFASKEDVVFSRPVEEFEVLRALLVERLATQDSFTALRGAAFAYADHLQDRQDEMKVRALLVSQSMSLRRRAALEVQSWVDRLASDVAAYANEPREAKHVLLTSVILSAVTLAATTWGGDEEKSLVEHLEGLLDELANVF